MSKAVEDYLNVVQEVNVPIPYVIGGAMLAYNIYRDNLTKAQRICGNFYGDAKSMCVIQYKLDEAKKLLTKLKSTRTKCTTTKDPSKCMVRMDKKIEKVEAKLGTLNQQLTLVQDKIRTKRAKA